MVEKRNANQQVLDHTSPRSLLSVGLCNCRAVLTSTSGFRDVTDQCTSCQLLFGFHSKGFVCRLLHAFSVYILFIYGVLCQHSASLNTQHLCFNNIHCSKGHAVICFTVLCTLHVRSLPLRWMNFKYSINCCFYWRDQQALSRPYMCSAALPDKHTVSHLQSHVHAHKIIPTLLPAIAHTDLPYYYTLILHRRCDTALNWASVWTLEISIY